MLAVRITVIGCILFIAGSTCAKDDFSSQDEVGFNVCFDKTLTLKLRGAAHNGPQIEQVGEYFYNYKREGLTSKEGSVGFESLIGKAGDLEISGGGEMLVRHRLVDDSMINKNYFEVAPAGLVNASIIVYRNFRVQSFNRLERRFFRGPGKMLTHLRYSTQTRFSTGEFTSMKLAGYVYYQDFIQKEANHMAGWGTGITLYPINVLQAEAAFTTLWYPTVLNTVDHQVAVKLVYKLDFSK